jgi:hypothetical protein
VVYFSIIFWTTFYYNIHDNEFVKSLPFVKIAVGLYDLGNKIHSHFLTKKILRFLFKFSTITDEEKEELIDKLDNSLKYSKDFGERLLLIIDSYDDFDKASLLGQAVKPLSKNLLEVNDFMRLSHIINRAYFGDLTILAKYLEIDDIQKESLYNLGLLSLKSKMIENGMSGFEVRMRLNQTDYVLNDIDKMMIKIINN